MFLLSELGITYNLLQNILGKDTVANQAVIFTFLSQLAF